MKQSLYLICGKWRVGVGSGVIEFVSYFNIILLQLRIIRYLLCQSLINELYFLGVVVLVVHFIYLSSLVICIFG
jgi:hypothetical protein